jgi:hypothetical protein
VRAKDEDERGRVRYRRDVARGVGEMETDGYGKRKRSKKGERGE